MGALNRLMNFLGFDDAEAEEDGVSPDGDGVETPKRRAQLFGLHAQKQTEIVVLQPATFEDARAAADYLKMRRPVVVNLQGGHGDLARRIVDFTSGVTYALDGHMLRVGEEIFLFTPSHVSITADLGSGNDHTLFPLE
ncbi:MAG TPA: cell division protein SepF [bacterium]